MNIIGHLINKLLRPAAFWSLLILAGSGWAQSTGAAMTLYKDGTALIKQPVAWTVETGINNVHFDGFPDGLLEDSPFLVVEGARVGYQRLNLDVFTWDRFYRQRIGEEVEVRLVSGEEYEGFLRHFDRQQVILQDKDEYRQIPRDRLEWILATGIVENPPVKPYLSWDIYSRSNRQVSGELSYLTGGFDWNAIYRLVLEPDTTLAELVTEAIIYNRSDFAFSDLELQLVEGHLHRTQPAGRRPKMSARGMAPEGLALDAVAPRIPAQSGLGDYHIYYLPERIALEGQKNITVRLYNSSRVNLIKTYLFTNSERSTREEPLMIEYKFANTVENELNKPLPQGKVEIYQATDRGGLEFMGEDNISQVPRGEVVALIAGRAFDVMGKRRVINYDRQRKSEEAVIELTVANSRDEGIDVHLIEHISGDWVIRNESAMYIKVDANTINFPLEVPADSTISVTYTYRKAWN